MRNLSFIAILLLFFSCSENDANQSTKSTPSIRLNQVGYYPNSVKKAVVVDTDGTTFEIRKDDGTSVYSGKLTSPVLWDKSGEQVQIADFTSVTETGKYTLYVNEKLQSAPFQIIKNLYADAFKATLKSFYYTRASMYLDEQYAGQWKRNLGHPDTLCMFHPSAERGEGTISSSKGWYDAGDCNKYIVNGGVSVGTLLNFYECYPAVIGDNFSNIPESGNGISDLLDEVRYELDWVLTMQAPDGASHFKLTSKGFADFVMPEADKSERFVVGKSTASTLNFAAMTAQAARLYKSSDSTFANTCSLSAQKAWDWAVKNPFVVYKNPADVQTGEYGDSTLVEEFWWAASELYLSTGNEMYANYLKENTPYMTMEVGESWRAFLGNIGSFSLLLADSTDSDLKQKIKTLLLASADGLVAKIETLPYRIPVNDFQWGSNSDFLNSAIVLAYAYKFSGDKKYLDAVVETTDYVFGKNATGYSFVTGFGTKTTMHPHNRYIEADSIEAPIAGFVAGGPNANREDDILKAPYGVEYTSPLAAKSYEDKTGSFASNETAINWNAPAVFVLGFLEANADKL